MRIKPRDGSIVRNAVARRLCLSSRGGKKRQNNQSAVFRVPKVYDERSSIVIDGGFPGAGYIFAATFDV